MCGIARTFDEAIAIGEREKPTLAVLDLRISAATCSRCADHRVGCGEMSGGTRRELGLVLRLMEQVGGSAAVASDHGTVWTLRFAVNAQIVWG